MRVKWSQRWSRAARWSSAGERPASVTAEGPLVNLGHHVLDLRVVLEAIDGKVLAVPRLLEAAVRHLRDERDVVVDPDRAELELARGVERPADVARPDRCREAVVDVVRPGNRLVVVGEALHGHDRPEHLFLHELVGLVDVDDHGRLDEEATVAVRVAARENPSLRARGPLEKAEDAVLLRLRDHGAHLDVVALTGIADAKRLDGRDELLDQLVVDAGARHDARGGGAVLPGIPVARDLDP